MKKTTATAMKTSAKSGGDVEILCGDNLPLLKKLPTASFDLIYIDPPFNTGKTQVRRTLRTSRSKTGDRIGYQGVRYESELLATERYSDDFGGDYLNSFLKPRLGEGFRLLKPNGNFFLHLDYREVHRAKLLMDDIFGRPSFINEIIWAYDYGARSRRRWSAKHDNILWYAKDPTAYTYNYDAIDRIPYMAPSLVGKEKAAIGKTPTDVWWNSVVGTNSGEKTGYPSQKPLRLLERIVTIHSNRGDNCLDFFAGSGSFGEACLKHRRAVTLIDNNPAAAKIMRARLGRFCQPF